MLHQLNLTVRLAQELPDNVKLPWRNLPPLLGLCICSAHGPQACRLILPSIKGTLTFHQWDARCCLTRTMCSKNGLTIAPINQALCGKSKMTMKPTALNNPRCWKLIRNPGCLKNKCVFNKLDLSITYKPWITSWVETGLICTDKLQGSWCLCIAKPLMSPWACWAWWHLSNVDTILFNTYRIDFIEKKPQPKSLILLPTIPKQSKG